MKGRKPKPTIFKILENDKHKDRINYNEPSPAVSIPTIPDFLNDEAKKEWFRVTPKLEKLGLISDLDRAALAAYCQLYGRWIECEKVLKEKGVFYRAQNGKIQKSPILVIANESFNLMLKVMTDFGLTPSSRSRLSVSLKNETESPMEKLLNRAIQEEK